MKLTDELFLCAADCRLQLFLLRDALDKLNFDLTAPALKNLTETTASSDVVSSDQDLLPSLQSA